MRKTCHLAAEIGKHKLLSAHFPHIFDFCLLDVIKNIIIAGRYHILNLLDYCLQEKLSGLTGDMWYKALRDVLSNTFS